MDRGYLGFARFSHLTGGGHRPEVAALQVNLPRDALVTRPPPDLPLVRSHRDAEKA